MSDASPPPHAGRLPTPRSTSDRDLARARERFLSSDDVPTGVVREPILASWRRSRDFAVPTDHLEMPYLADPDRAAVLTTGSAPVLAEAGDQFGDEPLSVILTDAEGVVLRRLTGDRALGRRLDRVSLAPGFSYAEQFVGTNGIGTALEGGAPAQVFGHEHYVEHLEELACAGAPVRHPITGKVLGVVDLTCWSADAGRLMVVAAANLARAIEEALLERAAHRELALLHDYLAACRRNRGPVLAVSKDLAMFNDAARQAIDPGDQTALLAVASEALASGKPAQLSTPLPSGAIARLQCTPSWSGPSVVGGVARVQLVEPVPAGSRAPSPSPVPMPGTVGSGTLWVTCRQRVETHFRAREWLLLEGEAGTGKLTLARAAHLAHTPAAHLRVLDATDVTTVDPDRWLAAVREELVEGRGTVILRHVDRLPEPVLDELSGVLGLISAARPPEVERRQWVVATLASTGPAREALDRLTQCFAHTVSVPPLRHHIEDLHELVPYLIARLTKGADLHCSPAAMRIMMRTRWPGNTEQLHQVIRKIVAHRRTGLISPADLPPEVRSTSRRVLTPLEAIECDAIVDCLLAVDGNRAEAARHLGMSRATIYRKIRDYGIAVPAGKG